MTALETLILQAEAAGIIVFDDLLVPTDQLDGLYIAWSDINLYAILINKHRPESYQRAIMAEELGHHFRTAGEVLAQRSTAQRKSEAYGRQWAYDSLLPAQSLAKAFRSGDCTIPELCDRFQLPAAFIQDAIAYHARKRNLKGLASVTCHWCAAV